MNLGWSRALEASLFAVMCVCQFHMRKRCVLLTFWILIINDAKGYHVVRLYYGVMMFAESSWAL